MYILKSTRCKIINLVHHLNQKVPFSTLFSFLLNGAFGGILSSFHLNHLNANALFSISLWNGIIGRLVLAQEHFN